MSSTARKEVGPVALVPARSSHERRKSMGCDSWIRLSEISDVRMRQYFDFCVNHSKQVYKTFREIFRFFKIRRVAIVPSWRNAEGQT